MNLTPIRTNMTELDLGDLIILFSYKLPVAAYKRSSGGWYTRTEKKWSDTTARHINLWLKGNKAVENPQSYFDNLIAEVK